MNRHVAVRVALAVLLAPVALVAAGSLFLLPFSRDLTGDLRHGARADAEGRLTVLGVAAGTPADEPSAAALLARDRHAFRRADFGTRVLVLPSVEGDRVRDVRLLFDGNPLALARLARRWSEVFRAAGGSCIPTGSCYQEAPDGGGHAYLRTQYAWYGPESVLVSLEP